MNNYILWTSNNTKPYVANKKKEVEELVIEESIVKKKAVKEIFKAAIKKDNKHQHQILNKVNLKNLVTSYEWPRKVVKTDSNRTSTAQLLKMIKR